MKRAFTLIELLVVVSIIAVLLALLMPALDRAIYQAELVQCGGKLKSVGSAVIQYAFENKRYYPDRGLEDKEPNGEAESSLGWINVMALSRPSRGYDMRPRLSKFMDINTSLQCPFTRKMDLVSHDQLDADVATEASYAMFWGWRYRTSDQTKIQPRQQQKIRQIAGNNGESGIFRVGDRFSVGGESFSLLANDIDLRYPNSTQASHPDRDPGYMALVAAQNELIFTSRATVSRWIFQGGDAIAEAMADVNETPGVDTRSRGLLDNNFLYDSGAVVRVNDILNWRQNDGRMERIPLQFDSQRPGDALQVPRG